MTKIRAPRKSGKTEKGGPAETRGNKGETHKIRGVSPPNKKGERGEKNLRESVERLRATQGGGKKEKFGLGKKKGSHGGVGPGAPKKGGTTKRWETPAGQKKSVGLALWQGPNWRKEAAKPSPKGIA